MKRRDAFAALLGLIVYPALAPLGGTAQTQRPLVAEDFRYHAPLTIDSASAVHQAALPLALYQGTLRSDLGDMRVFNAAGEVVPYAVRRLAATSSQQQAPLSLPYFPLYADAAGVMEDLQLRVRKDASGTFIDLQSGDAKTPQQKLAGYLIDARSAQRPLEQLEFDWQSAPTSFAGTLKVEASDDLSQWRELLAAAPVSRFEFQGHRLEQRAIELPMARGKYLRLSWPKQQAELAIAALRARTAAVISDAPREWLAAAGAAVAGKAGEYMFDLGAHVPVDRVRIELPQSNTLVEASLLARPNADSAWQPVASSVLYRLSNAGQELTSADLAIDARALRHWLLRVDQRGGGIGGGAPRLHAGWLPNQLLFVARGAAPFQLAYGAADVAAAEVAIERLLPGYQEGSALKAQRAQLGAPVMLASTPMRAAKALPWKKYALWAILVAAVALLGWMAYRLTRQMESNRGKP